MNRMLLWVGALALPLMGFGYSWATTYQLAQQGEEWLIPVKGYDPRDLLRGHFIQYRYDWPVERLEPNGGEDISPSADDLNFASALCIEGKAPDITGVSAGGQTVELFDPVLKTPTGQVATAKPKCAIIAKATLGTRKEVRGLDSGILYISQAKAPELEQKLRDPKLQGMIRVKIREDGVMRPVKIEFRSRPANAR